MQPKFFYKTFEPIPITCSELKYIMKRLSVCLACIWLSLNCDWLLFRGCDWKLEFWFSTEEYHPFFTCTGSLHQQMYFGTSLVYVSISDMMVTRFHAGCTSVCHGLIYFIYLSLNKSRHIVVTHFKSRHWINCTMRILNIRYLFWFLGIFWITFTNYGVWAGKSFVENNLRVLFSLPSIQ